MPRKTIKKPTKKPTSAPSSELSLQEKLAKDSPCNGTGGVNEGLCPFCKGCPTTDPRCQAAQEIAKRIPVSKVAKPGPEADTRHMEPQELKPPPEVTNAKMSMSDLLK